MTSNLSLSDAAARQINKVLAEAEHSAIGVRLEVLGGGCSGYQYKFGFADALEDGEDMVIEHQGARLIVDKTSLNLLTGSEVDYSESLMEAGFRVVNPNAETSCGCGNSFSIKS